MFTKATLLSTLISAVSAGSLLWDGRFNDITSSSDLEKWSFSNPVGPYQYYIHGSGPVANYVNLDSKFANPADSSSKQGAKITIDSTSRWNGQTMLRTELIPQTSAAINKGKTTYHFSIKIGAENKPTTTNEHQLAFFESHFTELKYGGSAGSKLQWHVSGSQKWEAELVADEWHNVAYEVDFDAGKVTFWHSTGGDALTKTAGPVDVKASSDGKDWHVGVLRLPGSNDADGKEDWFYSGVYVESGDVTTAVGGAGGSSKPVVSSVAQAVSTAAPASTVAAVVSSAKASAVSSAAQRPVSSKVVPIQTPVASPIVVPSSGFVTSVVPIATSTASAKPQPTSGSGPDAKLPEEFTLKQFIAWLKAKQGIN